MHTKIFVRYLKFIKNKIPFKYFANLIFFPMRLIYDYHIYRHIKKCIMLLYIRIDNYEAKLNFK